MKQAAKEKSGRRAVTTGRLFVGEQAECKAFLRHVDGNYIYVLRRPDGRPFYVGQGKGSRVFFHENEARHVNNWKTNDHKLNVIRSIWRSQGTVKYEIDFVSNNALAINEREEELIARFGRLHEGGPLTNRAPGGRSLEGPSPFSKSKHTLTLSGFPETDPEQAVLNRFVLGIAPMKSAVLKPESRKFVPKKTQSNRATMSHTLRQGAALAASAAANGVLLDGPCRLPRRVTIDGVCAFVENGVSCDIMVSGLATILPSEDPADEMFSLTADQAATVVRLIGKEKCIDLGILTSNSLSGQRLDESTAASRKLGLPAPLADTEAATTGDSP